MSVSGVSTVSCVDNGLPYAGWSRSLSVSRVSKSINIRCEIYIKHFCFILTPKISQKTKLKCSPQAALQRVELEMSCSSLEMLQLVLEALVV